MEHLSNEELFRLLEADKESTEKVFTELYYRYAPQVFAYCRRFLNNHEEAQDVFQETFIKFHQSIEKRVPMTNLLGYLLTIARNQCYNLKRNERFNITYDEYVTAMSDCREENDALLDIIKRGIELLPDDLREIFILREYDGLSYSEIVSLTNANVNTIKVKLFRAKKKLRKILEPFLADLSKYE